MSVLEVEFVIPDTVEELFALIGDPAAEPLQPFTLLLYANKSPIGKAAIGIYTVPREPGETVASQWPAVFEGPLDPSTRFELRSHKDAVVAEGDARCPSLRKSDRMECSCTLVGQSLEPLVRRRWWRR